MKNPIRKLIPSAAFEGTECNVVNVFDQAAPIGDVFGFGGAFTETSAYNYSLLPKAEKKRVLRDFFDPKRGMGYGFCRIPMGSCDFALAPYSLSEKKDLSDFSIAQDRKYIIPMVKDALAVAGDSLFLFASPWSPPSFMKSNGERLHGGKLLPKYRKTYADLFVKFLRAYRDEGIAIRAVTVQNEPKALQTWESCEWTAREEAEFAVRFLRPALDKAGLKDVKILVWDHNKERLFERACEAMSVRGADKAIWGFGYHWYSGTHFEAISETIRKFPGRPVFATENCVMIGDADNGTGSLAYAIEYCDNLRHGSGAVCDWNLLVDTQGGPYHDRFKKGDANGLFSMGCGAALIVDPKKRKASPSGIFGAIAPFACNFKRGDKLLPTSNCSSDIHSAAALKKDGSAVLAIVNVAGTEQKLIVRFRGKAACVHLAPRTVAAYSLGSAWK